MVWLYLHPDVAEAYLLRERADEDRDFGDTTDTARTLTECRFNVSRLDDAIARQLDDCSKKFGPGVIVIGDSHAIDFFGVIASRFDAPYLVGITQHSCRAHDPEAGCQFDDVLDYLSRTKGGTVRLVVYTQAGFYLLQTANGGAVRRDFFENRAIGDALPQTHPDAGRIEATLSYLERLSQFTKVKWVGPRTEPHIPFNHFARVGCKASFTLRPGQAEAFASLDTYIEHLTAKSPRVSYASQNKIIAFDWSRDYTDCKDLFFVDGDHYSEAGEIRFGRDLPPGFLN